MTSGLLIFFEKIKKIKSLFLEKSEKIVDKKL